MSKEFAGVRFTKSEIILSLASGDETEEVAFAATPDVLRILKASVSYRIKTTAKKKPGAKGKDQGAAE